jgi:hypothetical protein
MANHPASPATNGAAANDMQNDSISTATTLAAGAAGSSASSMSATVSSFGGASTGPSPNPNPNTVLAPEPNPGRVTVAYRARISAANTSNAVDRSHYVAGCPWWGVIHVSECPISGCKVRWERYEQRQVERERRMQRERWAMDDPGAPPASVSSSAFASAHSAAVAPPPMGAESAATVRTAGTVPIQGFGPAARNALVAGWVRGQQDAAGSGDARDGGCELDLLTARRMGMRERFGRT